MRTKALALLIAGSAALLAFPAPAPAKADATAFVVCNLYAQYEGRQWEFHVSKVGKIKTGTGAAWPDSSDDPISKVWGAYLGGRGADVAALASGQNPDYPVCHGSSTAEGAERSRANWLRDVRGGKGNYIVHEEDWTPSGVNE